MNLFNIREKIKCCKVKTKYKKFHKTENAENAAINVLKEKSGNSNLPRHGPTLKFFECPGHPPGGLEKNKLIYFGLD